MYSVVPLLNDNFENKIRNKKAYVNTLKSSEQYLYDNLKQVGIRAEEALAYIENKLRKSLALLYSFREDHYLNYYNIAEDKDLYTLAEELLGATSEAMSKNIHDKYNADLLAINCIENEIFKISVDNHGRVHTPLTNMSRMLRQFLYNMRQPDVPFYSLDLSCSQPFFLNILLKAYFGHNSLPQGVQQYIDDTSAGELYEKLMMEAGIDVNEKSRRKFKKMFFGRIFYCGNHRASLKTNIIAQAFNKLYPEVFEFIKTMKENDYREFSKKMQRAESTAFIGQIVTQAQIEGIWVSTVHDSTIVLKQDVQTMYTIIETVFKEEYLLNPNIKVESLDTKSDKTILPVVETVMTELNENITLVPLPESYTVYGYDPNDGETHPQVLAERKEWDLRKAESDLWLRDFKKEFNLM